MERLGPGGRGPETDRPVRPAPPGGPPGATPGLTPRDDVAPTADGGRLSYALKPAAPFRLDLAAWTLRRRPENIIDRWDGRYYRRVLSLETGPAEVSVHQVGPPDSPRLHVAVESAVAAGPNTGTAVTSALERLLGLRVDLSEFEHFAARDERLGPLASRFRGMKPPRFLTVFESVVNAIACQQVTLTLGIRLTGRLAEAYGRSFIDGDAPAPAFPRPEELARARPEDIRALGFSLQKARALIELSTGIVEGRLDLESLSSATDQAAVERLCTLRGVGRWTAEYVLLRGLGRVHVFPGDDVGARNNLIRWLDLDGPLDYDGVHRTIGPWKPYGGLIYFHLLLDSLAGAGRIP